MFRITITTAQGAQTNKADFATEAECQVWYSQHLAGFAEGHVSTTVNVEAEYLQKEKLVKRTKKRIFGEALIDKISTMNDAKNLSTAQVDAFMENDLIISLREHLWAGNISTFIAKLTSNDVTLFFSAEEKSAVLAECQTFLTSLGE